MRMRATWTVVGLAIATSALADGPVVHVPAPPGWSVIRNDAAPPDGATPDMIAESRGPGVLLYALAPDRDAVMVARQFPGRTPMAEYFDDLRPGLERHGTIRHHAMAWRNRVEVLQVVYDLSGGVHRACYFLPAGTDKVGICVATWGRAVEDLTPTLEATVSGTTGLRALESRSASSEARLGLLLMAAAGVGVYLKRRRT